MKNTENENIETRLLLEAIHLKYGYDFRSYAKASLKRRIRRRLDESGLQSISEMQHQAIYDRAFFEALLLDFSINVTEMFRDPAFFRTLRQRVLPALAAQPFIKIWHAGCASGEDVYSMAIFLKEMGLYEKTQIYATDVNEVVLKQARDGIFPIDQLKKYTANYQQAGGTESFRNYYAAHYDSAILDKSLKENIVFANHNLVTDAVFARMNMIVCRNVLIYFSRELQDRACGLFFDSLCEGGFLCIGLKESVRFSKCMNNFESFVGEQKIYRKRSSANQSHPPSTPERKSLTTGV